jgi:hypothetical protein
MRKIASLIVLFALVGCSGGGNTGTQFVAPAAPNPTATPVLQSDFVTPTFTFVIPAPSSSTGRAPQYINGTSTLSVSITLISNNGTPTTVTNPTVNTNITPPCAPCTVPGPPSPPGTDRYTVTTYDAVGGASGTGHVLSTATKDFTITAGSANTGLTITLFGVVKTITIGAPAAPNAGTTPADATLTVTAQDAASGTITGTYGDNSTGAGYISNLALNGTPVTVTINETDANGATLVASGGATQNSTTSVTLHNNTDVVKLHYAGLAENQKTITAAATGSTNGTANFQPTLQAITPSSGTEIDLYVDSTTGGTGSSGTQNFTEAGFTGAPYNQLFNVTFTITSSFSTPCNQIATVSQGTGSNGGKLTATAPAAATPPLAGSCDMVVNDGLTQGGHVQTAKTVVTYTTSSVGASSTKRH